MFGFIVAAIIGLVATKYQQDKAKAAQASAQKKATAAAASSQRDLAGESAALTDFEMNLQVGQRKIASLEDALMNQPASQRVVMLPSNQPEPIWVDKVNASIDSFIRG